MDIFECSSADALRRLRRNASAQWTSSWDQLPAEGTAWRRITDGDYFLPSLTRTLHLTKEDKVFTIGSCFAREVEAVMERLGFEVPSRSTAFAEEALQASGFPHDYANRYNPWSIANELRWALDPAADYPVEALQELPDGRWLDPHSTPVLEYTSLTETLARRDTLRQITRKVSDCRLIVLTLGLVETFYDTHTKLFTNHAPWLSSDEGRFRFRVLSFDETMEALAEVHVLLTTFGHPDVEVVVTTSPVPLQATFTGEDVVVANTYSKAVLRAAAGQWSFAHDNVHYFPSFEIVMNSSRQAAWRHDGRHVRPELVRHIMEAFTETNLGPSSA